MAGGTYAALSGLQTRMEQLDRLAADIANAKTAGYKSERVTTNAAERPSFGKALQAAIDVTPGPGHLDFRPGSMEKTGRDLDFAIEGKGFFVVDTPQGARYTRNGNFQLAADGTVTTADGHPVQTANGPLKVARGASGPVSVSDDGTVSVGTQTVGKFRVVDFGDYSELQREELGRFRAPASAQPTDADVSVRSGVLEASNVSVVDRMVALTEVARGFEALQRGLNILSTELDGRAITELGRR
ncbi:flagellar basal-body rod protein FlgF [Luteitalea sp. TBR-22]|uniref:flagellar hook-basal body protein n=1 Tax=Luteitalea sp. TBR-22 TaxID=2802971 RepID=UPI001AF31FE3|nr:flagellar hook basal-body protein [Luteitalea sp. TBR-22]BCS33521.1 flagellar basal-body rod protein FlgF [Luteitalea sp. TBR-22]